MAEHNDDVEGIFSDVEELEEALCALAGSDSNNCSYSQGYVKRQAVFACNTCTPKDQEPAGICLACANKCHDEHDIFELYTKRNFRCDCGNKKFGDFKCQLLPDKDPENNKNLYNHNFRGCYCTCDRPYPDSEDQVDDEMIQCVLCEDWFHDNHLGCSVEEPEELQEMVCEACMNKAPFLWTYAKHFAVPPKVNVERGDHKVAQDTREDIDGDKSSCNKETLTNEEASKPEDGTERSPAVKRTRDEAMMDDPTGSTSTLKACTLKELQARGLDWPRKGAVFWPCSWRSKLCTCTSCKREYVSAGVQFLMDPGDTLLAYEQKGLEEPFGQNPLEALISSMDPVERLKLTHRYEELTQLVRSYLHECVVNGESVSLEGVQQYYKELRFPKRCRTKPGCD